MIKMTLYQSIQIVDEKIKVMHNKLYRLLNNYNIDINENNTFTELIEQIDKIPGVQYHYIDNNKPTSTISFNDNDSLLRKEINIYYKIEYLSKYLKYALLIKGIPKRYINEAETLDDLIDLVGLINNIKSPTLTIDINTNEYYYNSYINLPYTLIDEDNEDITDGYIIVLEDDIEIARINVGEDLRFLPSDIGKFTYSIYYSGTDDILPTEKQDYNLDILPPALILSVTGENIGESQYAHYTHECYDEDTFQLNIITINPYINTRLINIPFTVIVPQENGNNYYNGTTDLNGECQINISSNKVGTCDIIIKTTNDNKKLSNNNQTYSITIYHNPIKINNYIFYTNQLNKEMEINCYNRVGELTNNYYTSNYKIIQKYNGENYHIYDLANKTNPFIINETHDANDRYNYTYQLYQNNTLICTTTNSVKIKREINIELIPANKFLTKNTQNIQFYIYVTDHLDNPIPNTNLRLIDTYYGLRDNIYTTDNNGIVTATIDVSDIIQECNGFLLQAVILDQDSQDICQVKYDDYSNAVYYRIDNDNTLNSYINIETVDTYSLEQLSFNTILTMYDNEGERILRPITRLYLISSASISTSTTVNIIDGSYANINLDTNTYENLIGDTLTLIAEYNGEDNHYSNTINSKSINFIKSNVVINTSLPTFTVYDESELNITLTIPNIDSKYITGDTEIIIDNDIYSTTRNNNNYTTFITPLNAKQTQLSVNYNGNKYTNVNVINYPININKTNKYNLTCNLDNDEIYIYESITFIPTLIGTTETQQTFTGTITYEFSNGNTITRDLNSFTYTPSQVGEQSVTITYNGDNNHYSKTITKTFLVKKLNPSLTLSVPETDAIYRNDINYKASNINYSGNNEGLTVKIYDNDTKKYESNNIEHDENVFNITTKGQHAIKLQTNETNIYNSLTIEKSIETYDFLEETYKILQDILNEQNYTDTYLIANKTEKILDCILNNQDDYDEDTLQGFYNILNALE